MGKTTDLITIFVDDDGEDTISINVGCSKALHDLLGKEAADELCISIGEQVIEEIGNATELISEESEIVC